MKEVHLASYNDCTGCGACASVCHKNAIRFDYDKNGFLRPSIDNEKCVSCGLCTKACPALHQNEIERSDPHTYTCYTAWTKDNELAKNCSSGGFSTQLMIDFLKEEKSIIYGAAMSDHNTCAHIAATSIEELRPIMGTKYIQSDASWALSDAIMKLKDGWRVLFAGTPCQIAAINKIVPKRLYGNLFTMELICHGTPSKLCTDYTCLYYNVDSIVVHRSKRTGWFVDGKKHSSLPLRKSDGNIIFIEGKSFFSNCYSNFMNPSCFHCQYARPERIADLSIGDQWGLAPKYPNRNILGASSVIVCTPKGLSLLKNSDMMKTMQVEANAMSSINAPNMFHPTWNAIGQWLGRHAYIATKLPLRWAFAYMTLNHHKLWILIPLKILKNIGGRNFRKKHNSIIKETRKKYDWV